MSVAVSIFVLFSLTSCNYPAPTTEKPILKIGVLTSLTGNDASVGQDILRAIQLAQEQSAPQSHKVQIQLVVEDSQCKSETGVNAYKKLAEADQVAAVIGIACSGVAESIAPLAQSYQIPTLLAVAGSYQPKSENQWIFKFWPENQTRAGFEAKFIWQTLKARRIAVLYTNNARDKGLYAEFEKEVTKLKGEIVLAAAYEGTETNFKSWLTKIKTLQPDALFILGYEPSVVNILKQAWELDLKTKFVTTSTVLSQSFLNAVGPAGEGVYLDLPIAKSELSLDFEQAFSQKYKDSIIHPGAYFAYDSLQILLPIVDQTQDKRQIKNHLFATDTAGVSGRIKFDEEGKNEEKKEFGVVRVEGGGFAGY